jgi:predicted amidohydrolase YtcJ
MKPSDALRPIAAALLLLAPVPAFADTLFRNARIWTGDSKRPQAEAMLVADGRIVAIGADAVVRAAAPAGVREVDLGGLRVLPGFNDAHVHYGERDRNLLYDAGSLAEIQRRLAEALPQLPPGEWLVNGGWAYTDWPDKTPDRRHIDAITGDRPTVLHGRDGHMVLLNTAALRALGIDRTMADPQDGRILRRTDGEPTGELTGTALALARTPPPSAASVARWLERDFRAAATHGITSAQLLARPSDTMLDVLEDLARRNALPIRLTVAGRLPPPGSNTAAGLADAMALRKRFQWPRLRFGVVKGFLDGTIDARTAHMLEPLSDGSNGFGYYADVELADVVQIFDTQGFQIATHATGDAAIRQALDAFARAADANGLRDRRHRIEHIDVPTLADKARLKPLGVLPSSQPNFAYPDQSNLKSYAVLLGDRMARAQVYHSLNCAAHAQPFGSDFPVSPMDMLKAIHTAVTRTDRDGNPVGGWYPMERLSIEAAIRNLTAGGAYASFAEQETGMLKPGMRADFLVLSLDILSLPADALLKARVEQTWVDGIETHRASGPTLPLQQDR